MSTLDGSPLAVVYDTLYELTRQSARLNSLIKPGNFIRFNEVERLFVRKENATSADFPELAFLPMGAQMNPHANSCNGMVRYRWSWFVNTNDMRATIKLLPIEFALFACLAGKGLQALGAIRWNNVPVCKNWNIPDSSVAATDAERTGNNGLKGWSSVFNVETELYFPRTKLVEWDETTTPAQ